jgi:hypothetical protein
VIDADGGDLHTQDREDASTTGESSESESDSESENESENESYEDPAEVLDKEKLKNAYRVLGLTFADSSPTEQERKLVL